MSETRRGYKYVVDLPGPGKWKATAFAGYLVYVSPEHGAYRLEGDKLVKIESLPAPPKETA